MPKELPDDLPQRRAAMLNRSAPPPDLAAEEEQLNAALDRLREFIEAYLVARGFPQDVGFTTGARFCNMVRSSFNLLRICVESVAAPPPPRG